MTKFGLFLISLFIIISFSCNSLKTLSFDTEEEKEASAREILNNPVGTYPVSNDDIPLLIEYTKDSNPYVRQMALFQLKQLKSELFLDDILHMILDPHNSVSKSAEELLINSPKGIELIRTVLESNVPSFCIKALEILSENSDRESLSLIIELFNHQDPKVVDSAIDAAAELGTENDEIFYKTLLRPETSLRVGVVKTLGKIGNPSVMGTLLPYFYDPETRVKNAVKFVFIDFGDKSLPYLLNLLNNPEPETQLSVLGLLEALQNPDSIPDIIQLFNNENERVKAGAINAVMNFGDKSLESLGQSIYNENEKIALISIELLGEIQKNESLDYLTPLLISDKEKIRIKAFNSILNIENLAGERFLSFIDNRNEDLYYYAIKGLMSLQDKRLVDDDTSSMANMINRGLALIQNSPIVSFSLYIESLDISGILIRDYKMLKEMDKAAILLTNSEKNIINSGSIYTSYYISRNDFKKKSNEALQLSFSLMHAYMNSKNPEDLELAKKQQEYSIIFSNKVEELDKQLERYQGSSDEERILISTLEKSRNDIKSIYESISLGRKRMADKILLFHGLTYREVVTGDLKN